MQRFSEDVLHSKLYYCNNDNVYKDYTNYLLSELTWFKFIIIQLTTETLYISYTIPDLKNYHIELFKTEWN